MLKKYKKRSNQCVLVLILGTVALMFGGGVLPEVLMRLMVVAILVMLLLAFCFLSKSKGYHWALGLPLALFVPLSLIVFWLLPDRCKEEK